MTARTRTRVKPPHGLVVEKLTVDNEELVVFTWGSSPTKIPSPLSRAESAILLRIVKGESNREIAKARKTSERTIANQVASLLRKTHAASRFELIRRFAGATDVE